MLIKNDVFVQDGVTWRVLETPPSEDGLAWVFPVADEKGLPRSVSYSSIADLPPLPGQFSIQTPHPSEMALDRARKAWQQIAPLVVSSGIFIPTERNQALLARAAELGCSPQTLLKNLRRYWAGGQTIAALTGRFNRCGSASVDTPARPRGRKPVYQGRNIYLVTTDDKNKMEEVIRRFYLKGVTVSVPAAYMRLLEEYYSYQDGNNVRYLKPLGERPSLDQFRYFLEKNFSLEERLRDRLGDKEFERNHRSKLGAALDDCLGIGHVYEIDATIADVWLVSRKSRSKIIGKPTLYLIYDKYSRLVVGFYAGLEAASWPAATQAILSIAEDKAALCWRHGVPYDPADWPATGMFPQTFVADRGEMLSRGSSLLSENMRITVKNAPALRPDRKGTVECGFKLIQRSMADSVPGYEPPHNVGKRRGKKYDKDACLTLDEFMTILVGNIIAHNRFVMKDYPLSAELLAKGIRPTPICLWDADLRRRTGALSRYAEDFVRFSLAAQGKATVTREGIWFKGCYYTCPEAIQRGWFVKAGKRRFAINVSYDRRLVDAIYLHDGSSKSGFIEAVLSSRSVDYKGLSFDEVAAYEFMRGQMRQEGEQQNAQEQSRFHELADPIADKAHREMKKETKGKSRASRKADVKDDRLEERRERRQEEVPMKRSETSPAKPAPVISLPAPAKAVQPNKEAGTPLSLAERLKQQVRGMLDE